jgi:hypothetical protein
MRGTRGPTEAGAATANRRSGDGNNALLRSTTDGVWPDNNAMLRAATRLNILGKNRFFFFFFFLISLGWVG